MSFKLAVLMAVPAVVALAMMRAAPRSRFAGLPPPRGWWLVGVVLLADVAADLFRATATSAGEDLINRLDGWTKLGCLILFLALNLRSSASNSHRAGVVLVGVGGGMNALASAVFGGMPVSRTAAEFVGFDVATAGRPWPGYVLAENGGPVAFLLGDFVPIPVLNLTFSLGDFALFAGLPLLLFVVVASTTPSAARDHDLESRDDRFLPADLPIQELIGPTVASERRGGVEDAHD